MKQIKKIRENVNLVVAHNPGSFYPAQKFAKEHQIPFGIDLEDYHPGETNELKQSVYSQSLLQAILPHAGYISAASPLILEETKRVVEHLSSKTEIVLNYFSENEFIPPEEIKSEKLKMVWFSQNIAEGRGLEEILPIIKKLEDRVELHLFGHINNEFYIKIGLKSFSNVVLHDPLPQQKLHLQLSSFDIGLALEPGKDLNNEFAISNKMLAYFQAGIYVVASDTDAQKQFIQEHPEHGVLTTLEYNGFEQTLNDLWNNKSSIRSQSENRFANAKKNSWEMESQKLVQVWERILQ